MRLLCYAAIVVLSFLLLAPAGCVTTSEARFSRDQAAATRDRLVVSARELRANLDALPSDDPARPPLMATLAGTQAAIGTLSRGIVQIDTALADPDPQGDSLVGGLSQLLPVPWRAPLVLGGVGLGLFLRSRQLRDGITTIAQGIEIAKAQDPAFRAIFQRHANTFRSIQSPTARKLVDEITGRACPDPQTAPPGKPMDQVLPEMTLSETSMKPGASYSQES